MTGEHIDIPEFLPGDYIVRYRGPGLPDHAIVTGDALVIDGDTRPTPGRLVVTSEPDGIVLLTPFEEGMTALGVVTGVMRRLS